MISSSAKFQQNSQDSADLCFRLVAAKYVKKAEIKHLCIKTENNMVLRFL